jgi:nitrogen fixation/metabolism regulation signal transduction histidine kinase
LVISVFVVAIISFFILSLMLRKRITEPIDELAATAEEVMQGNLDVEVAVHEGGEGLEGAFKEMVEDFRRFIARSMDDQG